MTKPQPTPAGSLAEQAFAPGNRDRKKPTDPQGSIDIKPVSQFGGYMASLAVPPGGGSYTYTETGKA